MIRIEHIALPAGLSAVARHDADGHLAIFVSNALEPGQQRAAVRVALRAARRHDWRFGLLPLPAIAALSAIRSGVSGLGQLLRAHTVTTTIAATSVAGAVAAGVVMFAAVPHEHGGNTASRPGVPSYRQSPPASPAISPGRARPGVPAPAHQAHASQAAIVIGSPGATVRPGTTPSPTTGAPAPNPSSSSAGQSPSPAPTSSPPPGRHCIELLGVVICL